MIGFIIRLAASFNKGSSVREGSELLNMPHA